MTKRKENRENGANSTSTFILDLAIEKSSEKKRRMGKRLRNGNTVISGMARSSSQKDNSLDAEPLKRSGTELASWEVKKERKGNSAPQSSVVCHVGLSSKDTALEAKSGTCSVVHANSNKDEMTLSDAGLSAGPGKTMTRRKRKKKNHQRNNSTMKTDDTDREQLLTNNASLEKDNDTKADFNDAEASLTKPTDQEIDQNESHDFGNNDSGHKVYDGDSGHRSDIIESLHGGDGCFISETAEQLSCSSNSFDCCSVKMHDNAGVNSSSPEVKSLTTYKRKKKLVQTYHRKRRKPPHSPENDLKCVGNVGSSMEIVESGSESALSKFSNEAFESAAHVRNKFERGGAAGEEHLQNVVEHRSLGKSSHHRLDDQHTIGENMNKIVMDNLSKTILMDISAKDVSLVDLPVKILEQAIETQKNIVACQVPSVEAKFEEPTRLWKDNDFFGVSGSDLHGEHKNQKQQSERKITTLISQQGAAENGALEAINRHNCPRTLESLERTPTICYGRKLLVLDVNGLLADIVPFDWWKHKPDTVISRKAVFKRPFCDDFLQFCFERFNVGVWSSRTKRNVEYVIDFLLGEARQKLLFCWDQSHCTDTGFYTVENKNKPLLLKELQKLWEKLEPSLPWEKGEYNESNTLLLDDTPHKALRNPPNTAIFPKSYAYKNEEDNSLGPGGDLRLYLEGLASADSVQKYVEQNPFGQQPITESNLSWTFYLKIIHGSPQLEDDSKNSSQDVNGDGLSRSDHK